MTVITVILGIAAVILLVLHIQHKSELKSIAEQIRDLKNKDTNSLVHSKSGTADELILEINSLLKELRSSRIVYNQKNHSLDQMMTNISHDLRTPLTSAMGYIDLLRNSEMPEAEKNREIDIIEKRLVRLEELINSFFELSKAVSSGKSPEKTNVNLVSVLEEAIVHYYDDYCSQNKRIIFNCEYRKIDLFSNRNMLLRVFDNLIGNALKHGGGDLTVTVEKSDGVLIGFRNAIGSSEIDIEHIFDEFYTTDISRTKGNTGLGLAIAKQFTEILDGSIGAVTDDGNFIITVQFKL